MTPNNQSGPVCSSAVAVGSAVQGPSGLDGSPHLCSAGTCTIRRFLAEQRPMTPEERNATDKFSMSHFKPNIPL